MVGSLGGNSSKPLGRRSSKNRSEPRGWYAAKPWIGAHAAAAATLAATSARQQVLSSAASSQVSGGTRRVLTVPATDAFAMIATAQIPSDMLAPPRSGVRVPQEPLDQLSPE